MTSTAPLVRTDPVAPGEGPGNDGRPLRGVLWDLDGTVVDSEPAWFAAETMLVERYGGTWSVDQAVALVGSDLKHTAAVLRDAGVPLDPTDLIATLIEFVAERVVATRPWRPGILRALAECREAGLACALVSMSWRRFTTAVAGLVPGTFAVIVSGDEVQRGKPEPDAYLIGAAKLGLEAADCVAIEDSPTGVAAALAAGIATVAVPNPTVTNPGAIAPAPGLALLGSTDQLTVPLLRRLHKANWALALRTAGTCPGTSTSRTASP